MYQLHYRKSALKVLQSMPIAVRQKLLQELNQIALDPFQYSGDWKPLQGSEFWRLRVGKWRVICDIQQGELVLLVVKIGARGDVYK